MPRRQVTPTPIGAVAATSGAGSAAARPAVVNPDDRPIVARGFYDLSFFDTDNEYETYGLEVMRQDDARVQAVFQRYLTHLNSDFVSDADFDREFTYERLLELDAQLMRRGGLAAGELRRILAPVRGIEADCTICMERSTRRDRMARLACAHAFHTACLQQWLAEHASCPLCRLDLRAAPSRAHVRDADTSTGDHGDGHPRGRAGRPSG